MNNVNLIGRLTRDPENIDTDSDTEIAKLRLAVDRRGEGAVFVDVKAFGRQADSICRYLAKGREVAVSGRLELDQWVAGTGEKRSRLYIIAANVQFLGQAPQHQNDQTQEAQAA